MRIHWLNFTVFSPLEFGVSLWDDIFSPSLGSLVSTDRQGRGFTKIFLGLNEAKLYGLPSSGEYFSIELTGSSCDCLSPDIFIRLLKYLKNCGYRFQFTRIDFAFDDLPFTPVQFCENIMCGHAITHAKLSTLSIIQSPFSPRDDDTLGCDTVYLGSKTSDRLLRVYNRRGGTRLEMVLKSDWAQLFAVDLFSNLYSAWYGLGISQLLSYIKFKDTLFPAWDTFVSFFEQSDIKIHSARVATLTKLEKWLDRQVAPALYVYQTLSLRIDNRDGVKKLCKAGSSRDISRYSALLDLINNKSSVFEAV